MNSLSGLSAAAMGALQSTIGLETGADIAILIILALLAALAGLTPLTLPRGDRLSGDGAIVMIALLTIGPVSAMVVSFVGAVAFWLVCAKHHLGLREVVLDIIRRVTLVIGVNCLLLLARPWVFGSQLGAFATLTGLFVAGIYVTVDLAWEGVLAHIRHGADVGKAMAGVLRTAGGAYMGQVSISVVVAVLLPAIGVWSVLILGALILAMRQSLASYLDIKRAYHETILALARGAEIGGVSEPGRAERLADLCVAVGRRVGLRERQLETLSYAALLHDLGLLGETDAEVAASMRGATVSVIDRSARVLEDIDSLKETAVIIRHCEDWYQSVVDIDDWRVLAAQVLSAVVEFEAITAAQPSRIARRQDLAPLLRDGGARFHPGVVEALLAVVSLRT